MPKTVSSPGPKSHGFCGQRGFQEAQVPRLDFDRRLKLEFRGSKVTSDAGFEARPYHEEHAKMFAPLGFLGKLEMDQIKALAQLIRMA